MLKPLEFGFTIEPGITESEIKALWENTQLAQKGIDRFLAGEISEHELTDYLDVSGVNIEQTRDTLEENLQVLQIPYY